jgi:hypothetical protein
MLASAVMVMKLRAGLAVETGGHLDLLHLLPCRQGNAQLLLDQRSSSTVG